VDWTEVHHPALRRLIGVAARQHVLAEPVDRAFAAFASQQIAEPVPAERAEHRSEGAGKHGFREAHCPPKNHEPDQDQKHGMERPAASAPKTTTGQSSCPKALESEHHAWCVDHRWPVGACSGKRWINRYTLAGGRFLHVDPILRHSRCRFRIISNLTGGLRP